MSKIEKLIKELCPNGVEYKKLYEITCWDKRFSGVEKSHQEKIVKFEHVSAEKLKTLQVKNGYVKLLSTGLFDGYTTEKIAGKYINNSTVISLPTGGSANLKYYSGLFVDSGNLLAVSSDSKLYNLKFIFYNLKNKIKIIENEYRGSGVKHPNMKNILTVKIPVPPLKVQEEIVRILDKFGELETELEAELEARKSQYEFWRGKLLNNNASKIVKLGEVCLVSSGGTPSKKKTEYWENGDIKWLGSSVCCNKKTVEEVTDKITEVGLKNSSAKILTPKTTLIAMVGATIGKVAFLEFEACTNQNVASLIPKDTSFLNSDYLFYACRNLYSQFVEYSKGKFSIASLGYIKNLEIKVPSLQEQERIVNVLDKFDKLVNDISEGLPAEIEARRKQYEYYRNKLLSFEELVVNE